MGLRCPKNRETEGSSRMCSSNESMKERLVFQCCFQRYNSYHRGQHHHYQNHDSTNAVAAYLDFLGDHEPKYSPQPSVHIHIVRRRNPGSRGFQKKNNLILTGLHYTKVKESPTEYDGENYLEDSSLL